MNREHQQDSNDGRESFWDAHGVEFEAKYVLIPCFSIGPLRFILGPSCFPMGSPFLSARILFVSDGHLHLVPLVF